MKIGGRAAVHSQQTVPASSICSCVKEIYKGVGGREKLPPVDGPEYLFHGLVVLLTALDRLSEAGFDSRELVIIVPPSLKEPVCRESVTDNSRPKPDRLYFFFPSDPKIPSIRPSMILHHHLRRAIPQ